MMRTALHIGERGTPTMGPHRLLKKRERHGCRARDANNWRRASGARPPTLVDECGECRHRRIVGDLSKAQLDPERRMDLRSDNGAFQRVAAEVEEIVVPADIGQLEDVSAQISASSISVSVRGFSPLLSSRTRKGMLAERLSIDLVASVVGQAVQKHDSRWHHVRGQVGSHGVPQAWRRPRRVTRLDNKCDQHRLVDFSREMQQPRLGRCQEGSQAPVRYPVSRSGCRES